MRIVLAFALGLVIPLAAHGQVKVLTQSRVEPRISVAVERNVADRHKAIGAHLTPEAKSKLSVVSKSLAAKVSSVSQETDLEAAARAEVGAHFPTASPAQIGILSSYALADAIVATSEKRVDGLSKGVENPALKMQVQQDRRSKVLAVVSEMMRKMAETSDSVVGNLK